MVNEKNVSEKLSRRQREEVLRNAELPINKFLNAKNADGSSKYAVAELIKRHVLLNLDPVNDDLALLSALFHELRWRVNQAKKYFSAYSSSDPVGLTDSAGRVMSREDCFLAYLSDTHNQYRVVSKIRSHLMTSLLSKCDDSGPFTFGQYDVIVRDVNDKLKALGFDLFPERVVFELK